MIVRSLLLLLPLAIWTYLFISPNISRRQITASFLGFALACQTSLVINATIAIQGIWHTSSYDNLFYGVPLDWIFSQAVILGALIPLLRLIKWNLVARFATQAIMITVIYYSAGLDLTELKSYIIILCITLFCATPAMALSDWTANDIHVSARSFLQSIAWVSLLLWCFPSTVFHLTADSWDILLQRNVYITGLYLLPFILPAYLLVNALVQFSVEGNGTAFPYDPPKNLVTGGIYQHISNPMQVGICLMMAWWSLIINSYWIALSSFIALILFVVFKDVCNGSCAIGKGNSEWEAYQASVPKWIPKINVNS